MSWNSINTTPNVFRVPDNIIFHAVAPVINENIKVKVKVNISYDLMTSDSVVH